MAGKGDGAGEGTAKLDGQIACLKYTLFCFNIMSWVGDISSRRSDCEVLVLKRVESERNLMRKGRETYES